MKLVHGMARMGLVVCIGAAATACASSRPAPVVGTTSATGAEYTPGAVEVYVARRDAQGACPQDMPSNIEFPALAAELPATELMDIHKWAACLNRPELQHATVVLVGGDEPAGVQGLFVERAQRIRNELIRRGVDGRRVLIGAPNASREGGPHATKNGVRLEVSTTAPETMRAIAPYNDGTGRGVR